MQKVVKQLKSSERPVFKRKGNELNFKHEEAVETVLDDALSDLERNKLQKVKETLKQGKLMVVARKREIILADKHPKLFGTHSLKRGDVNCLAYAQEATGADIDAQIGWSDHRS